MLTFQEVKELLKERYDEITLLELLDIDSEQIVERFADKIEERYDVIEQELSDELSVG